ncbi:MAG TPA: DNA gyrase C-terminal beta-propeller domain-containing protein, partial [Coleofasciculaceae cyanobacterium]
PIMGRAAQGQPALRLSKQEEVVGCVALTTADNLLLISTQGHSKRMPVSAIKALKRGEIGVQSMQFANKLDKLAGIALAADDMEVKILTDINRMARLLPEKIPLQGRTGSGECLLKLDKKEKVAELIVAYLPPNAANQIAEDSSSGSAYTSDPE